MAFYTVSWIIQIEADTPEEAAQTALSIQRDPSSIATSFMVKEFAMDDAAPVPADWKRVVVEEEP